MIVSPDPISEPSKSRLAPRGRTWIIDYMDGGVALSCADANTSSILTSSPNVHISSSSTLQLSRLKKAKKEMLGVYAIERISAGAHFPSPWVFEPAKRLDDRADYCLGCSFLL